MIRCDKCRCDGRVLRIAERGGVRVALHVCANPRCPNYRREFGEEELPPEKAGGASEQTEPTR